MSTTSTTPSSSASYGPAHGREQSGLQHRAVPAQHGVPAERGAVGDVGRRRCRATRVHDPGHLGEKPQTKERAVERSAIDVVNSLDTKGPVRASVRSTARLRSRTQRSPSSGAGSGETAGLPHLRLHDLRHHTRASLSTTEEPSTRCSDTRPLEQKVTERYTHLRRRRCRRRQQRVREAHVAAARKTPG